MKCALLQSQTAFCRTPKQFKRCGSPNLSRNKHCCCRIGLLFLRLEWGLLLGTQLLLHPAQRVAKSRHIGRCRVSKQRASPSLRVILSPVHAPTVLSRKNVIPGWTHSTSYWFSIHTDSSSACGFSIIEGDTKTTSSHETCTVRQV